MGRINGNQIRQISGEISGKSGSDYKTANPRRDIGLTENPPAGDIKFMKGYSDGRQRLRVGKYRVVFRYGHDGQIEILEVLNIDSRGGIYKRRED